MRIPGICVAVFVVATLAAGCEESVDPVIGTEAAFTVYGFLNARADTQAVRVFPIEGALALAEPEPLAAEITTTDLATGQRRRWQDSVVTYRPGRFGYVYYAPFRPGYGARYRFEATRTTDGATSFAEVTLPPLAAPEPLTPEAGPFGVFLPVLWRHAPRLNQIAVEYRVRRSQPTPIDQGEQTSFRFVYPLDQEETPDGVLITLDLRADARRIFQQAIGAQRLCEIILTALVSDAEWKPPTGVYDAEILVEPGTFSNIENGFGFLGAGYPDTLRWLPPVPVLESAGFEGPCPAE